MKTNNIANFLFSNNSIFILLCVSVFLLPINLNLNSYFIGLTFLTWFCFALKISKQLIRFNIKEIIIHTFPISIAILGLVTTINFDYGFDYISRIISFLIFPLIFGSVKFSKQQYNIFFLVLTASCLLVFVYSGFTFIHNNLESISDFKNQNLLLKFNKFFANSIIHPTYFSMFLILNIFTCSFNIINTTNIINKFFFIIISLVLILFLVLLTSKMPIAALVVIALIVPIVYLIKNFNRKLLIFYLFSLITISFLGSIFLKNLPNRAAQEVYNYYNYINGKELQDYYFYNDLSITYDTYWFEKTNRIVIWKNCIELIKASPLYGYGTGDVQDELVKTYKKNNELWRMQFFNTHNQYLDYQLRYGIIGTILLILVLGYYAHKALMSADYFYLSFIILIILCFLTENIIQRQLGIVYFTFFNSLLFYRNKFQSKDLKKKDFLNSVYIKK